MIGGYIQIQQTQPIIIDIIRESTPLKIIVACLPILVAFLLRSVLRGKKDK